VSPGPARGAAGAMGTLVLVATPIGNLGDLAPRATETLATADLVCCEDTRRTRALLSHAGVRGVRLVALHAHNEAARTDEVLALLGTGATVAVVSDAGTPALSDPGQRLVAAAVAAGVTVRAVPGPSAALAALVVSGLPTDRFAFEGFLPRRGGERRRRLGALAQAAVTTIVFEAPGRVAATLAELAAACGPERPVAVARELTKVHEEVWRGGIGEAAAAFAGRELRGEVVVVVGPAPAPTAEVDEEVLLAAVRARLAAGDSARSAAQAVAEALGVARRRAYAAVLAVRNAGP